jgi:biopolymer transport protein ExbD
MRIPSPIARRKARIEIIPLIDIIFFLLATFVMLSLSMSKNQGLAVDLPAASTAQKLKSNPEATITVLANGQLYFDKDRISIGDLPQKLQQLKEVSSQPTVYLNGDAKASFGDTITVLDELRTEQITQISIQTRPIKAGR